MKKRFWLILLAIASALCLAFAIAACGGGSEPSVGLQYELNEDESSYSVVGIGDCNDTNIVIPSKHEGLPVTSIGEVAFFECSSLESIAISKNVTSIGDRAFFYCTGLESVTIGNSVTSIGDEAFYSCTSLERVTIGKGVTSIGASAFSGCERLTYITIPKGVTSIGDYAFACCGGLTSIEIPDSVTSIGNGAFFYCTGLESVTIGSGVTSIGERAFFECRWLERVYFCGTEAEWKNIEIGSENDALTSATRYYFSEKEPTEEEWQESEYWWHFDETTGEVVEWVKPQA